MRPERGAQDQSLDDSFCDYVSAAKIYVYNQRWIDRAVEQVSTREGFLEAMGRGSVLADAKAVASLEGVADSAGGIIS